MLEPTPFQVAMLAEKMSVHGLLRGSQEERQEFAAIVWRLVAQDVLAVVAAEGARTTTVVVHKQAPRNFAPLVPLKETMQFEATAGCDHPQIDYVEDEEVVRGTCRSCGLTRTMLARR